MGAISFIQYSVIDPPCLGVGIHVDSFHYFILLLRSEDIGHNIVIMYHLEDVSVYIPSLFMLCIILLYSSVANISLSFIFFLSFLFLFSFYWKHYMVEMSAYTCSLFLKHLSGVETSVYVYTLFLKRLSRFKTSVYLSSQIKSSQFYFLGC